MAAAAPTGEGVVGDHFYFFVSLAVSFEVERRIIAQNDGLEKWSTPEQIFFQGCNLARATKHSNFLAFLTENCTFLMSLTIYIEVAGCIIT